MLNDAAVRARIDPELKVQALAVLRATNDLEVVSGKHLWAMKRKAQARDHELTARGEVPPAAMLLLRPERLHGALVEWPDTSLIDD